MMRVRLLRVTEGTSRFPECGTLIQLLGVTCGMRVTEIRLEANHVLTRSGVRREEVALRGLSPRVPVRCVFLSHLRVD
jgi:integrase/recombinase XerD